MTTSPTSESDPVGVTSVMVAGFAGVIEPVWSASMVTGGLAAGALMTAVAVGPWAPGRRSQTTAAIAPRPTSAAPARMNTRRRGPGPGPSPRGLVRSLPAMNRLLFLEQERVVPEHHLLSSARPCWGRAGRQRSPASLSLIHISEPTRQ